MITGKHQAIIGGQYDPATHRTIKRHCPISNNGGLNPNTRTNKKTYTQPETEKQLMETETTQTTTTGLTALTEIIAGLALHASTDPMRGALQTIQITPQHLTATDSYSMAQWQPVEPITTGQPALINAKELTTALNNLTKAGKQYRAAQARLTVNGQTWKLTALTTDEEYAQEIGSYTGTTYPAEYPNTEPLLKLETCGQFEPTGFNPDYLERITKTSKKIARLTPLAMTQWQTPQKPVLWITETQTGKLVQLLMPTRLTPITN